MENDVFQAERRKFLRNATIGAIGSGLGAGLMSDLARAEGQGDDSGKASPGQLQVWSCGGLAEAMRPAHEAYSAKTGTKISYTGAFAAVLGKSLLTGSGETEVFAGRGLPLAQNLRKSGKMLYFRPFCFTSYLIVVPKGNPARIGSLEDMAKPGVRVAMSPKASPPGGQAVMGILKLANLSKEIMANVQDKQESCVQRTVESVCKGKADCMIVERRITRMPLFAPHLEIVKIPEKFFPPLPLTFTMGVMHNVRDKARADAYVDWFTGEEGQAFMERAGFIPAISGKGQELIEKLGVRDVA